MNLAFLASHGGSGMRAVVRACREGRLNATPTLVISNNSHSPALAFAREAGLRALHLSTVTHPHDLDETMCEAIRAADNDLVVLSGYMRPVGPRVLRAFEGRILNVHPSLLPKFGGRGMYGDRVHEAVLKAGETESGATVHLVDGGYDTGEVLARAPVPVEPDDTVETLRARVQAAEQTLLVSVLARLARAHERSAS
ncbi:phosphoribosylglycinamide formyltransferase [Deinococcus yavapaiensis]|uniref:Phosphoribosylglycinamide formyltransferase n=1 Tax=Deinococcus yavapaiensis KR-236 TaxID=694435 RepID=A0A318S6N6_9DEIO|nr:phosphoribosylglycinamide formyltransferase [Deinococcus yavapaiensis]PYE53309.1 formyltetrahydrofolate-dependent phosphoribosylglycinamide formyltransferase [Deinococcus yavapaiensis KR-236]